MLKLLPLSVIQRPDAMIELRQGNNFVPLCAADFPQSLGDSVCQMLGKSHMLFMDTHTLQTNKYAKWSTTADPQQGLLKVI